MKRETWIKRLALFLCAVLFVPSLLLAMPATQVQAATKYEGYLSWNIAGMQKAIILRETSSSR